MMNEEKLKDNSDDLANQENFEIEEDEPDLTGKAKCIACLKSNTLTIATMTAVLLGTAVGLILRNVKEGCWSDREVMYVGFPGELFLRILKGLILPLIVSSLVSAISGLDVSLSRRVAFRTIAFYMTTTFFAVVLGIILVVTIQPGASYVGQYNESGITEDDIHESCKVVKESSPMKKMTTVDTLMDLVRNLFPPNIVQACVQTQHTVLVENNETDIYTWKRLEKFQDGSNILGMVLFSAVLGIAIAQIGEEAKPVGTFFKSFAMIMMRITGWVIILSPGGVFFLVVSKIMEMKDMGQAMAQLGKYFSTVLLGLFIQGFIVLPIIYLVMARKSPIAFILNMKQALATAFGTASSSATLPLTIQCLEDLNGVDPRIARFAIPIGATINLDGTALYEAVAAIFIAQIKGVDLHIGNLAAVSITATAASMGAAGIPQAGLVTMVMVLDTLGLPSSEISTILAVDWLLDRFRTTINVMGDSFGAGIVYHRSKADLEHIVVPTKDLKDIRHP